MEKFNLREHWENTSKTKQPGEVSWFHSISKTSLEFINQFRIPADAKIIDIGGVDSLLADHLLNIDYQDITIPDISQKALARAKERLSDRSAKIKWIVHDAATFNPTEKYDFWHDPATFHFLTQ